MNGRFAEACKTVFMAIMFAALVQGVSAQSYSMKEKTYGSTGGGAAQSGAGTQTSQAAMGAATQLSGSIASISGATLFVKLGDGRTVAVALGSSTQIFKRVKVTLDSIKRDRWNFLGKPRELRRALRRRRAIASPDATPPRLCPNI